ncbi:MAG TPA: hypothetical protein VIF62_18670 [Labilithrix sp.]|jgi:uncharacterized protein YjhX (UPF0386 family)
MFCVQCGTQEQPGLATCAKCGAAYADGVHAAYHAPGSHTGLKVGPTNCRRRDGHVSRNCAITLLDDRIAVSSGTPTTIALAEIHAVRADTSYNGEHYSGTGWLILSLAGKEVGFMMKSDVADVWVKALSIRR